MKVFTRKKPRNIYVAETRGYLNNPCRSLLVLLGLCFFSRSTSWPPKCLLGEKRLQLTVGSVCASKSKNPVGVVKSPKVSGTQNGGFPIPYFRLFWGVGFPLHKPYPYSLHRKLTQVSTSMFKRFLGEELQLLPTVKDVHLKTYFLLWSGLMNTHWVSLNKAGLLNPYESRGGGTWPGGGWLNSHDFVCHDDFPPASFPMRRGFFLRAQNHQA